MEQEIATMENEGGAAAKVWASWDNPVLTPEQWGEVRRACEAGMTLPDAAKRWGVDYEAVKKRAQREEWLTETRIRMLAEQIKAKESLKIENANQSRSVPAGAEGQKPALKASLAVAESYEGNRSGTLLGLSKVLKNGICSPEAQSIVPNNVNELVQMGTLALKLYNVGQEGVSVNVLVGGDGGFDGPVIETGIGNGAESALDYDDDIDE